MTDVFIRHVYGQAPLRDAMLQLVRERWELEPCRVRILPAREIRVTRLDAERFAESDPYIFTDSDVLIVGKQWVERAVRIMLDHPCYGVASTLSLIEGENILKGEGEIYDCFSVGAPMVLRKGICVDLPRDLDLNNECGKIDELMRAKGLKEGLLGNSLRHNHMGHGFSSNEQMHWGY